MVVAKAFVATVFATAIRERIAVTATIANVLIMRSASGMCARLIVAMEDAMVEKTAGNVAATVIARVVRDATILGNVTLIVATEDAMVTRTVRHVMTATVRKTRIVALVHQKLILRAAWIGAATGLKTGTKIVRIVLKMLAAQKDLTAIMATALNVLKTVIANQESMLQENPYALQTSEAL